MGKLFLTMNHEKIAENSTVSKIELVYKSKVKPSKRPHISSSRDTYALLLRDWDEHKMYLIEQFKVLFLNHGNKVLAVYEMSSGGITCTIADPRLVFIAALELAACSIIVAHNHPSGELRPSRADEQLTAKMREAGKFLDIKLLDHVIISSEGYFSFADEGVL
jgi:DNA repair protein RadC